jgi:phosphoserine phosphatase RsbU/P
VRFFPKLLILLTSIALIPLSCAILYDWTVHRLLSTEISSHAGSLLIQEAAGMLNQAVAAYARLAREQGQTLELIAEIQAREMEELLAQQPRAMPKVYFSEDYDRGVVPGMVAASPRYDKVNNDGTLLPGRISLNDVDFKLAPGVARGTVASDIARLAEMTPLYRIIYSRHSNIVVSLYTALESGVISSYPGMGRFPENYDPRSTAWYKNTKKAPGLIWNPPYVDATGIGILISIGVPIHWPDGTFAGVTAVDVSSIQELPSKLPNAYWAGNLQVFLTLVAMRPDGKEMGLRMVGVGDYHKEFKDWTTPLEEVWLEANDQEKYYQMVREIRSGRSGSVEMPFKGHDSLWAYGLIDNDNTALVFIVPMENIVAKAKEMEDFVLNQQHRELAFFSGIIILAIVAVILFSYWGSRSIADPLHALAKATEEIAAGNLNVQIPSIKSKDEISDLTRSVASMKGDLKKYIDELTHATTSRERMESELRIARDIQMSFLPMELPQPPHGTEFSVFATIQPAREVGGDLYDLFFIDNTNLFFAIGDVSGKGVPAALLMAKTKTLVKGLARDENYEPHKIILDMNFELGQGNETCMFVTFFCGILNSTTGEVLFSNAGHNPPLLLKEHNEAAFLEPQRTMMLGVFEEAEYLTERLLLMPGDSLFLYTDGVTEAFNEHDDFYSAPRLQGLLSSLRGLSPEETIAAVLNDVRSFSGSAPQSDDITMLMIRFNGL